MNFDRSQPDELHYLNPVYPRSFPDPFVIKFEGEYFAYCTGFHSTGKVFGVLRSHDLVNWHEVGGAMEPLTCGQPYYWAPEVTYHNGTFYLYYSVGNETLMELRVAASDRPDGGFVDAGRRLTSEDFAIDAHVFMDDDGTRYLFYATDFLEHTHIGTGIVVDRMLDWYTLAGNPRPVTRAKYDWQVYDPNREEKGGVRWHTVEGPFVLKRKQLYYTLFSGGNWKQPSYGVSFAVSDTIEREDEWEQYSDGEKTLPILRTIPERVIGPGHNSAIRGPNNRELFCVYHSWKGDARVLAIDRMDFAGDRIFVIGATYSPQPAPFPASIQIGSENKREADGDWAITDTIAENLSLAKSRLTFGPLKGGFVCEFSFRALETAKNGRFGLTLDLDGELIIEVMLFPASKTVSFKCRNSGAYDEQFQILDDLAFSASHLARIELDYRFFRLLIDQTEVFFDRSLTVLPDSLTLFTEDARVRFSGFALTEGFEDLFDRPKTEPLESGWNLLDGEADLKVDNNQLIFRNGTDTEAVLSKSRSNETFEFVANLRALETGRDSGYGFKVLDDELRPIFRLEFAERSGLFYLSDQAKSIDFALPEHFVPGAYHQFRFIKRPHGIHIDIEGIPVGELEFSGEAQIALFNRGGVVGLEMARLSIF